jgi:hypothetical protein
MKGSSMRNKIGMIAIILTCVAALLMASSSYAADAKSRPTVSDAERALAMWQVQNTMSKHAYYHAAGMHLEELAAIWVKENGPWAQSATFASPNWIMKGVAAVKKYYGQSNQDNKVKELEAISKVYPEVKNVPENIGAGHEWAMHTLTTPIIEIAGDGKTAKAVWYSPGMGLSSHINGENVSVGSTFFWEKYGADFVKEDGEWKIWHCQMFYDFTPSLPAAMTERLGKGNAQAAQGGPGGAPGGGAPGGGAPGGGAPGGGAPGGGAPGGGAPGGAAPGGPGGGQGAARGQGGAGQGAIEAGERMSAGSADMVDNPKKYKSYSPARVPEIQPQFPVPYYTFSETFSY